MNTICIKTNNNNAINYLLEKLKKYNFNDISFTCRKFKIFQNLFLHYKGSDLKKFVYNISNLLTSLVIDIYEDDIIKRIIDFLNPYQGLYIYIYQYIRVIYSERQNVS